MITQQEFDAMTWGKGMRAIMKDCEFIILSVDFQKRKLYLSNKKWYDFYLIDEIREK